MNGLNRIARRVNTRKTTDNTQAQPLSGLSTDPNTLCQTQRMPDTG